MIISRKCSAIDCVLMTFGSTLKFMYYGEVRALCLYKEFTQCVDKVPLTVTCSIYLVELFNIVLIN